MSDSENLTVHVPIRATYRLCEGTLTLVDAEYADVLADDIAKLLAAHFNIPTGPTTAFAADDGKGVV